MARTQGKGSCWRELWRVLTRAPHAQVTGRHDPTHSEMPRHADEPLAELHPCAEEFAAANDLISLGDYASQVAEFARQIRAEFVLNREDDEDLGRDYEDLGGGLVSLGSIAFHRLVDYEGVRVPCGLVDRFSPFVEEWAHEGHISVIRMPARVAAPARGLRARAAHGRHRAHRGSRMRFRIVAFGLGLTRFEFELAVRDDGIAGQVVTEARPV